ncbi:hypothetical protein ES703_76298 [subsurface metagenome]
MPFSDYVVKQAWERSGGKCECTRQIHAHAGRCNKRLLELYRGDIDTASGWEACSKSGSYTDLSDCEILCFDCQETIHYL